MVQLLVLLFGVNVIEAQVITNGNGVMMEEVVITATRTENAVLDIPVRVNLITTGMLERMPAKTLDDVLAVIPGINISRPFGILSAKATITMRGMNGKEQARVLVLVDGVPINKSDGGTVDWNMIDPAFVRKIELTKGAGSALYGGDAMGGIINIITKQPTQHLTGQASLEYGSFNTLGAKLNMGLSHALKKPGQRFYWMANAFYRQSDGYITQSEADQQANPYIVKSNMKELGMSLKTGFAFNKNHSIELKLQRYDDKRGTGEKVFQPEGNTTEHDSYGLTFSYLGKIKQFELKSSAWFLEEDYKKVNEYLKDDYTWYDVLSVRRDLGWLAYVTTSLNDKQRLTAGFDLKNGSVDAYDKYYTSTDIVDNEGKMLTYALFVQDEVRLWKDKFSLVAGLRFDNNVFYDGSFRIQHPTRETSFMQAYVVPDMPVQYNSAVSPRLSLQYKKNASDRIYLNYSRGFRPSVLDDLCRSGRIKGGFKIANPAIKPEFLNNFEAGADLLLVKNLRASLSLYYSRGKDFQYYVSNGQTIDMGFGDRPIFIRANISKVEIYGGEAELRYDWNNQFSLFANYGYNHSIIIDYQKIAGNDTIDLNHNFLTDVPAHVFSLGGNWINKLLNCSMTIRYTGSMWINDQNTVDEVVLKDQYPAYTTTDIKLWHDFREHFQVSLMVQNLFDVKYYDSKDAVCPGRFITGTLTYKL